MAPLVRGGRAASSEAVVAQRTVAAAAPSYEEACPPPNRPLGVVPVKAAVARGKRETVQGHGGSGSERTRSRGGEQESEKGWGRMWFLARDKKSEIASYTRRIQGESEHTQLDFQVYTVP